LNKVFYFYEPIFLINNIMADETSPPANSGNNNTQAPNSVNGGKSSSPWITNVIIPIVVTLLLTSGIIKFFGDEILAVFNRNKEYTCTVILKNGPNELLRNVTVFVDSKPYNSRDNGTVIFKLKAGIDSLTFVYGNAPHSENFIIRKDTTFTFDIGSSLSNPITGLALKPKRLPQPNKNPNQTTIQVPTNVLIIPPTVSTGGNTSQAPSNNPVQIRVDELNANQILEHLELKVKIDSNDSYRGRGEQFAYHYNLTGNAEYLGRVAHAYYKRNDPTFPEYKRNVFNVSGLSSNNLEYVGYQWGSVTNTYVQVELTNGERSSVFLKNIVYEK
jgi:hypothetical protein